MNAPIANPDAMARFAAPYGSPAAPVGAGNGDSLGMGGMENEYAGGNVENETCQQQIH